MVFSSPLTGLAILTSAFEIGFILPAFALILLTAILSIHITVVFSSPHTGLAILTSAFEIGFILLLRSF